MNQQNLQNSYASSLQRYLSDRYGVLDVDMAKDILVALKSAVNSKLEPATGRKALNDLIFDLDTIVTIAR